VTSAVASREDRVAAACCAELILRPFVKGRSTAELVLPARRTLDLAWSGLVMDMQLGDGAVAQAKAIELERLILARGRDDALAGAASAAVYACRAAFSGDIARCDECWAVADELLETINASSSTPVTLAAVRAAVDRVVASAKKGAINEVRSWAQERSLRDLVRDLRPKVSPAVARLGAAAGFLSESTYLPASPPGLEDARRRAITVVGPTTFAKALERLVTWLPGGEADRRWGPTSDAALALVAADRITAVDRAALVSRLVTLIPSLRSELS
jgi:hypothetical protein